MVLVVVIPGYCWLLVGLGGYRVLLVAIPGYWWV